MASGSVRSLISLAILGYKQRREYEIVSLVQSILLHNAETWTLREDPNGILRVFDMSALQGIAGVIGRYNRRSTDIMKELNTKRDFNL